MHYKFESWDHKHTTDIVNPKIYTLLTFIFVIFVVTSEEMELPRFFLYILYLVVFAMCACKSMWVFIYSLIYLLPFMIFIVVMFGPYLFKINCLMESGFSKFCVDSNVANRLFKIAMKVSLAVIATTIYVKALTKSAILESLKWIGMPKIVVYIISITLLYSEVFTREIKKMLMAMHLRLFPKVSYITQWKMIAFKVETLFLRSYKKITMLIHNLKLRGYTGTLYSFNITPVKTTDFLFFLVMCVIVTFIKLLSIAYF